jgi:hypothetical protein
VSGQGVGMDRGAHGRSSARKIGAEADETRLRKSIAGSEGAGAEG